jgi:hypothetical protein
MTVSIQQLRPYMLDIADMFLVYLEDKRLPADAVEFIDFVRYELIWIEKQLYRRKGIRPRAPSKSPPMTLELRMRLRRDALAHPELTQQEIANRHGVNTGGRVNEALNGKLSQRKIKRPGPTGLTNMPDSDIHPLRPI